MRSGCFVLFCFVCLCVCVCDSLCKFLPLTVVVPSFGGVCFRTNFDYIAIRPGLGTGIPLLFVHLLMVTVMLQTRLITDTPRFRR